MKDNLVNGVPLYEDDLGYMQEELDFDKDETTSIVHKEESYDDEAEYLGLALEEYEDLD